MAVFVLCPTVAVGLALAPTGSAGPITVAVHRAEKNANGKYQVLVVSNGEPEVHDKVN